METVTIFVAKAGHLSRGLFTSTTEIPKWATSYDTVKVDREAWLDGKVWITNYKKFVRL